MGASIERGLCHSVYKAKHGSGLDWLEMAGALVGWGCDMRAPVGAAARNAHTHSDDPSNCDAVHPLRLLISLILLLCPPAMLRCPTPIPTLMQ